MIAKGREIQPGGHAVDAAEFASLMAPLGPFGDRPAIAVAVSGGPHSLALALLARDWVAARGGALRALVVDHGLRADSGEEAGAVAAMLASQGIAADILMLGLPTGRRVQERAREARLAALLAACAASGRPWLLLGHHRGDQAETLLFRAARGSGDLGLAAMAPVRVAAGALILRPLLSVPAERLEAVCVAAGLRPVRDPSNEDGRFARIRLRRALQSIDRAEATEAALAAAAAGFAARRALAEQALAARLAASAAFLPMGAVRIKRGELGADATALAALGRLIRLVGDARHAPAEAATRRLLAQGGGTLGRAWLRPSARDTWRLSREPAAGSPRPADIGATMCPSWHAVPLAGRDGLVYAAPNCDCGFPPRGGAVT